MPDRPPGRPLFCLMNPKPDDGDGARGPVWQWWVAAVLMIYALPFIVVMIDEKVLKTYWLYHHLSNELSDKVGDVFKTIYPFYKWFR